MTIDSTKILKFQCNECYEIFDYDVSNKARPIPVTCPKCKTKNVTYISKELYLKAEELGIKLEPIYKLLNWQWSSEEIPHTPNRNQIKDALITLVADLMSEKNKKSTSIRTGGLFVERYVNEVKQTVYNFGFRIEESFGEN